MIGFKFTLNYVI